MGGIRYRVPGAAADEEGGETEGEGDEGPFEEEPGVEEGVEADVGIPLVAGSYSSCGCVLEEEGGGEGLETLHSVAGGVQIRLLGLWPARSSAPLRWRVKSEAAYHARVEAAQTYAGWRLR